MVAKKTRTLADGIRRLRKIPTCTLCDALDKVGIMNGYLSSEFRPADTSLELLGPF